MRRAVVLALFALSACARGATIEPGVDSPPAGTLDATIDGNGCSTQPCSILPQCGCNGNTACDVDAIDQDGTTCRPINANGVETDSCNSPNECDRGFVCLGGSSFASCKKYCSGDADCGSPRGQCVYTVNGNNGPIAGAPNACSSNCDPTDTAAAGCPASMKCTLFAVTRNMMPVNIVDCSPAGTGTQGTDCTATNGTSGVEASCAKGFQCVRYGTNPFQCRKICNTPGTTSAACGGMMCRGFTEPFTLGGTTYGVCDP